MKFKRVVILLLSMIMSQSVWANPKAFEHLLLHQLINPKYVDEAVEAKMGGTLTQAQLKVFMEGSHDDYFKEMDYGITNGQTNQKELQVLLNSFFPGITVEQATQRAARGRNNWIVWTAGNDAFWDFMTKATFGSLDFIKTLSNNSRYTKENPLPAERSNRWLKLGLVNEPCFEKNDKPLEERWGLVLDKRSSNCPPDPYADEKKYPGIKVGSRGKYLDYQGKKKLLEVGSFYGYPTGVVGLRLFTNPNFDQAAANKWDPEKFYNTPDYYLDPKLVRPYRVGMSCAFCHVGPNPSLPPKDFNAPEWKNLNSNPGAQYFWVDRIFVWDYERNSSSFVYQLLRTSRPGTLDTSLISSDQINNPRSMNAVYNFPERVQAAMKFNHRESLEGDELLNAQFTKAPLDGLFSKANSSVLSPRVLKDGSDSVGGLGALNRVFVNIGLFSEEWIRNFIPIIGGPVVKPFEIKEAKKRSLNWQATENQTGDLALFFLAASRPDKLENAPGGKSYLLAEHDPKFALGRRVFAENCAACHSSKLPPEAIARINPPGDPFACVGEKYMGCWDEYWKYVNTTEFKSAMVKMSEAKDFLSGNFLSTEMRIPANVVDTQLCSPIATNAIAGNIWDNFASKSYKALPSVGNFTVNYPVSVGADLASKQIEVPGGGRGFLRPPSLVSAWSTAPFLGNNALGSFDPTGSLTGRMKSFEDSIQKLLNPETRTQLGPVHGGKMPVRYKTSFNDNLTGIMDVTTEESEIIIPKGYVPKALWELYSELVEKHGKPQSSTEKPGDQRSPSGANKENAFFKTMKNYPEFVESAKTIKSAKASKSKDGTREPAAVESEDLSATNGTSAIRLGPIPAGVPVNLLSNIRMELEGNVFDKGKFLVKLTPALTSLIKTLVQVSLHSDWAPQKKLEYFMKEAAPSLLEVSKCNDFVVNRGHYFGTKYSPVDVSKGGTSKALTPDEKSALIEYIKYF